MSDKPLARTVDADGFGRMRELLARPIDPVVVALNTRIVAQPDAASDGVTRSLLVFELGGERFAIEAGDSYRVVALSPVRRVPHRTNQVFAGLANVAGELTPVARLDRALGTGEWQSTPASRFIVIGATSGRCEFAVDAVEGVQRMGEGRFQAPPATVARAAHGCTIALVRLGVDASDARVALLDVARVCSLLGRSLQ